MKVVRAFFMALNKLVRVKLTKIFGRTIFRSLRTMTSGRGQFSMEFKNYMPCPASVSDAQ